MSWAGTPQFEALMKIEDPYAYRDRLSLPKFIVNSAVDQYFLPDSSQFYFDGLPGEKYLRYLPNTDHSLKGAEVDAGESALPFYEAIIGGTPDRDSLGASRMTERSGWRRSRGRAESDCGRRRTLTRGISGCRPLDEATRVPCSRIRAAAFISGPWQSRNMDGRRILLS